MTDIKTFEAPCPYWADTAMCVMLGNVQILTLYLKSVNFSTQRYYLGMELHAAPPKSALRTFYRKFSECVAGCELEALIDKTDKKAQRFCAFFGFKKIPNYEIDKHYVYERLN